MCIEKWENPAEAGYLTFFRSSRDLRPSMRCLVAFRYVYVCVCVISYLFIMPEYYKILFEIFENESKDFRSVGFSDIDTSAWRKTS